MADIMGLTIQKPATRPAAIETGRIGHWEKPDTAHLPLVDKGADVDLAKDFSIAGWVKHRPGEPFSPKPQPVNGWLVGRLSSSKMVI